MVAHQSKIKTIWIVAAALVFSIISGVVSHDLVLGGAVLFTGLLTGYFASIGKRCNYIFCLINYLLMGYVAFTANLYGTATFYILVCSPLQIYGFINWSKNLKKDGNVKARKFTTKTSIIVVASCMIGSIIVGYLLSLIPNERLSFLDAASNCVNLCGTILMARRYMESWWLWLTNNVIDCLIWGAVLISGDNSNALMMFITCVAYLITNIYGIYKWIKSSKIEKNTINLVNNAKELK